MERDFIYNITIKKQIKKLEKEKEPSLEWQR
jgi:hypothetical protein